MAGLEHTKLHRLCFSRPMEGNNQKNQLAEDEQVHSMLPQEDTNFHTLVQKLVCEQFCEVEEEAKKGHTHQEVF